MDTIIDDLNQIMVPVGHSKHFVPVSLRNSRVIYKQAICFATQLIGEDGTFNGVGLDNFMKKVKLGERGASHAVVAIMGPQCSGKSTLLNHLFHTNFKEMDASKGRSPTTKGLWIAKAAGTEPCTIVMDLQGTDQSELGEDDAAFAKQSARFVLAISDVVIINMWCRDIGLEQAASKRLMETIFQVMCWQSSIPSKTTLMFVIRDPVTLMQGKKFLSDMNKIWNSIPKSEAHKHTKLTENFNIQFVKLPSYEDGAERFKNQVARLRKILLESIVTPPASGFSFSAQQIWKAIKENKEIDLAGHKAEVRKKWNARPWTTKEETVLAQAWMNSPLNNKPWRLRRKSGSLWKQVLEYFRNQTGDTDRPVDQMNSKWKRMEQKITKFNDIYHRIAKHYNSQSESGILHFTHLEYRRLNDKPFANEAAWAIVKSHPKWSPSSSPSTVHPINPHIQHQKRLKISELESSSHTTLSNAHDSSSRDDEEDQRIIDEELELPQQIQETLVSSSSGQQDRVEQLQKLISEVTEISHILREDLEDKKRHRLKLEEIKLGKVRIMEVMEEQLQRTQKEKDLKFYLQPHDHLTGMELKVALRYKDEITRRWGWE